MIKFCPMCGEKIPSASSRFCNGCGLNLVEYRQKLERLTAAELASDNLSQSTKSPPVVVREKIDNVKSPDSARTINEDSAAEEFFERGFFATKSEVFDEAIRYYIKAIRLGDARSMLKLGLLYKEGRGVGKDNTKALEWFLKAGQLGSTQALCQAGLIQLEDFYSDKVPEKLEAAKKNLLATANAGEPEAVITLAMIYFDENNFLQARPLLEKAADFNLSDALYFLGTFYERGYVVPQNIPKAFQFYQRAVKNVRDRYSLAQINIWKFRSDALWDDKEERYVFPLGSKVLYFGKDYYKFAEFMSVFLNKVAELQQRFHAYTSVDKFSYAQKLLEELAEEGIKFYAQDGKYGVSAKEIIEDRGGNISVLSERQREIFLKTPSPVDALRSPVDTSNFLDASLVVQYRLQILLGFESFVVNDIKARDLILTLDPIHMPEEKFYETLITVLLYNPFNVAAYDIYLERYGDEMCQLQNFAVFFGMENELARLKRRIFIERLKKYSHRFSILHEKRFGDGVRNTPFIHHKLPKYSDLRRDYRVIDTESLKLQLDIYGSDNISFVAAAYRMLLKAFEDEKNSAGDDKRIPAFKYLEEFDLGEVVIPEGIEIIGAFAFAGTSMKSIRLPSTLKKIEAGAFYDCKIYSGKLEVPEGVEEISINMIGHSRCHEVYLPNSIKRISGEPYCLDIFLHIESSCGKDDPPELRALSFDYDKPTKFHFDFDRAEVLSSYFRDNDLMKHTTFFTLDKLRDCKPNSSSISIGEENFLIANVFDNEEAYRKIFGGHPFGVYLSGSTDTAPVIGFRAFANSHVIEINLPENLKVIRDEAFYGCRDLEILTLPRSLEKLGSRAFCACENLEYVIIPETLKNIGDDTLKDCPAVIYCDSNSTVAEYCRKNNLPMEDYGAAQLQEGRRLMANSRNAKDVERAGECLELAAYVGNVEACYEFGKYQLYRKLSSSATEYFKRAAEHGHRAAMFELYKIYRDGGLGVEKNLTEAENWLRLSDYDAQAVAAEQLDNSTPKVTNYADRIQFVDKLFERFKNVKCLYFSKHGDKSYVKISAARDLYASEEKSDSVICVFDNTLFGGADDGFLVTNEKFYAHNAFERTAIEIPLEQIQSLRVQDGNLLINDRIKVSIAYGGKIAAENIPILLSEIQRAFVG